MIAIILNGPGLYSSRLHMFPLLFTNKPLNRLIDSRICEDNLNDNVLKRCLHPLFALDVSALH
ncbi:MAG: DUF4277 domain-containing protein [Sodalis sp. (in: enterobacteria)]